MANDGGPAFPVSDQGVHGSFGMSLGEYAAIKLGVPESGLDWLDDMIRKAQRSHFAGLAMQGLLAAGATYQGETTRRDLLAADAYAHADAMLAEREKGE